MSFLQDIRGGEPSQSEIEIAEKRRLRQQEIAQLRQSGFGTSGVSRSKVNPPAPGPKSTTVQLLKAVLERCPSLKKVQIAHFDREQLLQVLKLNDPCSGPRLISIQQILARRRDSTKSSKDRLRLLGKSKSQKHQDREQAQSRRQQLRMMPVGELRQLLASRCPTFEAYVLRSLSKKDVLEVLEQEECDALQGYLDRSIERTKLELRESRELKGQLGSRKNTVFYAPQPPALRKGGQETLEKTITKLQEELSELKSDRKEPRGCDDNKMVKLDKLIDLIRNFQDSSSQRLYLDSEVCGPEKVISHLSRMDASTYQACCIAVKDDRLGAHTRLVTIISQILQDNPQIEQQAVQWAFKEAVPVLQAIQRKLDPVLGVPVLQATQRKLDPVLGRDEKDDRLRLPGTQADMLRLVDKQYTKEADKLVRDWNRISGRISGGGTSTLSKLAAVASLVVAVVLAVLVVNWARGVTLTSEFTIQYYTNGLVRVVPGRGDTGWRVTQEDVYGLASFATVLNYLASTALAFTPLG